ncbi:MAG TPA: SRPBCC family protein [Arthrobacter sp.]|nr:SRPBCC family protein [Arthrobacter sp.]
MHTITKAVEVEVPVSVAYNQWTQFESFPRFMSGVEDVRQIDDATLHFSTKISGVKREYDARITEQVPDTIISWESLEQPRNAGSVRFDSLGPDRSGVSVTLEWEPETFAEKAGAALSADEMQVAADLDKFKDYIEDRQRETGAWRGTVGGVDVEGSGPVHTDTVRGGTPLEGGTTTGTPLEGGTNDDGMPNI